MPQCFRKRCVMVRARRIAAFGVAVFVAALTGSAEVRAASNVDVNVGSNDLQMTCAGPQVTFADSGGATSTIVLDRGSSVSIEAGHLTMAGACVFDRGLTVNAQ